MMVQIKLFCGVDHSVLIFNWTMTSLPNNDLSPEAVLSENSTSFEARSNTIKKRRSSRIMSVSDIFELHSFTKDTSKKYVLSLDGGGMRVHVIIKLLKEIEHKTHRRVKKKNC
jgi:7,8-dihydro-6-hydroxymethylpterin-pyrophosphokinase